MNNTLIITGGNIDREFALKFIANDKFDNIIAVDGGLKEADEMGIKPDYIVGDFDTIDPMIMAKYIDDDSISIRRFNPEKDFTDTESAVKLAIEINSFYIHILGGIGTRVDHSLANVLLLQMALDNGIKAEIISEKNRIRLLGGKRKSISLTRDHLYGYKYVSLLPMTDRINGITIEGMKYPLNDYDMIIDKDISMGVSNEIISREAKITIADGILILIESRD